MNYDQAVALATKMHAGQVRKYSGEPYITHPLAVSNMFIAKDRRIVAVLHDIIEDTNMTMSELKDVHHLRPGLADAVQAITKRDGQDYLEYILQVMENKIATAVKLKDLEHNMSDLDNGALKDKYLLARYILLHKL